VVPTLRQPIPEDARQALAALIDRWHDFSDLRALADVELRRGSERQRLTGVLLARAPDSFRFEALSPFGQPLLYVAIHEGRLLAYDATSNEALTGPANAETSARMLHLPVDPDDLVAIVSGRVVPPKDLRVGELLPPDDDGPSIRLIGRLHEQRVWLDPRTGIVRQVAIRGGRLEARVVYHRDADGRLTGLDLEAGQSYLTASVRYRQVVVDGGVEPERFHLTVPKGAKIQTIR
jgi:outer membrane lipoprotein-sorting protein